MKKFLLFCLFSGSASFAFAAGEIKESQAMKFEVGIETVVVNECIPVGLSCGTYALCNTDMSVEEMIEVVESMESFYCG